MTTKGLTELRKLFSVKYDVLKQHLTRQLGSSELASDALHDAYVKLASKADIDKVEFMQAYLMKTAVRSAINQLRSDVRDLGEEEIEALYQYADPAAGPEQILHDRFDLEYAVMAMEALPPRQRDILYAVRVEGLSIKDLAKRWGISERMVNKELRAAHEFCARRLSASHACFNRPPKQTNQREGQA